MERHNISRLAVPYPSQGSFMHVLNSILKEKERFSSAEDEITAILQAKKKFRGTVEKYNGPLIIPTVFRNHSDRCDFLRVEHRTLHKTPTNPPEEKFMLFTFADEVYMNIFINFSKEYSEGKHKSFLLHKTPAKLICLAEEFSAEEAFEEMLSQKPFFYADKIGVRNQSLYADKDLNSWRYREECCNDIQFVTDFSIIYPDDIWSSVVVSCYECGRFAETTFCDAVKETARGEIWHNIVQLNIQQEASERGRYTIRLPSRSSLHAACSFREGLIGVIPLTRGNAAKPSLYVRVRLSFFTNDSSRIGHVLHNYKEDYVFYQNVQLICTKLNLNL